MRCRCFLLLRVLRVLFLLLLLVRLLIPLCKCVHHSLSRSPPVCALLHYWPHIPLHTPGFVKDRERLLTGNRSEIRKMIERRHLCEVQFLKEKIDMTDAYRQTCASGHDRDIIAHNELMATLDEIIPSR